MSLKIKKYFYVYICQAFIAEEEDEIAKVLRLSLQTAQEDEKRRKNSFLKEEKPIIKKEKVIIKKETSLIKQEKSEKGIKIEKSADSIVISDEENCEQDIRSQDVILPNSAGDPRSSFGVVDFGDSDNSDSENLSSKIDVVQKSPKLRNRSQKRRYTFDSSDEEGPLDTSNNSNKKKKIIETSDEEEYEDPKSSENEINEDENYDEEPELEGIILNQGTVQPETFEIIDSDDEFDEPLPEETDLDQSVFDIGNQPPVEFRQNLKPVFKTESLLKTNLLSIVYRVGFT